MKVLSNEIYITHFSKIWYIICNAHSLPFSIEFKHCFPLIIWINETVFDFEDGVWFYLVTILISNGTLSCLPRFFYFYHFYQLMTYFNSFKIMSWELRCEKGRRKEKKYNKKISLKICTKQGVNLKIRWGNGSPEWLDWTRLIHSALLSEIGGSSLQWCEGKLMLFSVVSYIVRPDRLEGACFWSVSGLWKSVTFTDCHLVMGDFIHHDKAYISMSNLSLRWFCLYIFNSNSLLICLAYLRFVCNVKYDNIFSPLG